MKVFVCFLFLLAGALGTRLEPGISGRILGGDDTYKTEFPSVVSLEFCIRGNCQHACGGAIISQSWIVTAAHCLTDVPVQGSFRIVAGIIELDDTSYDKQEIRISHAFIHPGYKGGEAGPNDLAVIKVVSPFTFNDVVQPIRIISSGYPSTGVASVIGWGAIGGTITPIMPNTQQSVRVPILSYDECAAAMDRFYPNNPYDIDANVCTGPLNGAVSSCVGDSGNPLIQDDTLIGVVTWGPTTCGVVGAPSSIHTKLYTYRNWIASTIDEVLLP